VSAGTNHDAVADRIISDLHFTPPEGHDWKLKLRVVEALEQAELDGYLRGIEAAARVADKHSGVGIVPAKIRALAEDEG
jgi:hypothetical protein